MSGKPEIELWTLGKYNGFTLELYNQDDADRFDRFGVVFDGFGVVLDRSSAVFDRFGICSIISAPFAIVST